MAAVDIDSAKIGRDIGDLCGLDEAQGVAVRGDLEGVLAECAADVVALCTSSVLASIVAAQLALSRGIAAIVIGAAAAYGVALICALKMRSSAGVKNTNGSIERRP